MPLVKSRPTSAMAETMVPTFVWKELTTKVSGQPAPRPDGKNLWIDIDIDLNASTALFHCTDEEHVHDHKPRSVTFRADQDCLLTFSNADVFSKNCVQLFAHKEVILSVKNDLGTHGAIQTLHGVYTMAPATEAAAKSAETKKTEILTSRRPPVIVVP